MSGAATGLRRAPPRLGEHTEEVLNEARALSEVAQ
jgi:formyl-CoA transferase